VLGDLPVSRSHPGGSRRASLQKKQDDQRRDGVRNQHDPRGYPVSKFHLGAAPQNGTSHSGTRRKFSPAARLVDAKATPPMQNLAMFGWSSTLM